MICQPSKVSLPTRALTEVAETAKAIAAFAALAERLDGLAAERATPCGGGGWRASGVGEAKRGPK